MSLQKNQTVKIKNPNLELNGDLLEKNTIEILKEKNHTGVVHKIEDDLVHVHFKSDKGLGWVTQLFNEDELERV